MADPLFDLLTPYFRSEPSGTRDSSLKDGTTVKYLNRLTTLQLESLDRSESQSLAQASHSTLLSLQSLSTRSSKSVIASADHLNHLQTELPSLARDVGVLRDEIKGLDKAAVNFSEKYSRSGENEVLDRRKKALLMYGNVDRLSDILDLPTLLASAISPSNVQGSSSNTNYASALDLHSHIKRLHLLYQDSGLLKSIYNQAEDAMREMTSNLIMSLRGQSIKLAAAMRTIGWLRRIAPELNGPSSHAGSYSGEGSLGALFLVCRLANLMSMFQALEPLRELADQETQRRSASNEQVTTGNAWSGGQQTERYLKRYIEIFREQSFAIISMFKSIFPSGEATTGDDLRMQFKSLDLKSAPPEPASTKDDPLHPLPSALATFPIHLVDLFTETLKQYLPNVRDKASRESLLTQVLYCAGSLGRLGADFGMILSFLEDSESDEDSDDIPEWVVVMKKHRMLAGRLELLAGSTGGQGKGASTGTGMASKFRTVQSPGAQVES
ncbi:hypothetical protein MMC30_009283 [Trapelia coarctata]|nr:hypothetical protein [Trapelia coarctata]